MRLINADQFKQQIAIMTIANGYDPNLPSLLCKLIDNQPTTYEKGMEVKQVIHNLGSHSTITGKQEFTEYRCPTCGISWFSRPNFCGKCGTKLIWPNKIKRDFEDWGDSHG